MRRPGLVPQLLIGAMAVAVSPSCKPPTAERASTSRNLAVPPAPIPARHSDARAPNCFAPVSPAANELEVANAWIDAFRRQDMAAMSAHTRYPFELRDTGTAGRRDNDATLRIAASAVEMPEVIGPMFADAVLVQMLEAERDVRVEERTSIPSWAEPWRAVLTREVRMLEAYFRTDSASFSLLLFVDGSSVRALWKNGFDASQEVDLATRWVDALRRHDLDALERLTSYPFELRDTGVEAHCGSRVGADPKSMPRVMDCLLADPILNRAMIRLRSGIEAGRTRDYEPGIFKGWRRAEHQDLWPATLLIGTDAGNEYDLTFLVAKNGVRVMWKRGSFVPAD